jgi:hypothetical protein
MAFRSVGFVVALLLAFLAPRIADACGVWHMEDKEKKVDIEWLINSGRVNRPNPKAKPDDYATRSITLGALYLDIENKSGLRVVRDGKVVFDIVAGKLRKFGKVVATIDGDTIKFGSRAYAIAWVDKGPWHDFPSWAFTVKRGDAVVLESAQASALCAGAHALAKTGKPLPDADQLAEIRNRIAFYLAWREVGDR